MNIKLVIEYIGTNYSGWQRQSGRKTVQGEIEQTLELITGVKTELIASGRTDAGVHAYGQVANYHTLSNIPPERIKYALNYNLSKEIRIIESKIVEDKFHSRFGAKRKTYIYRIQTGEVKRAFEENRSYFVKDELDFEKMKESSKYIIGTHDFSAFKSEGSTATNFVRRIYSLDMRQSGDIIELEICGSGFLYNMVRIIAGTLIEIGKGRDYSIPEILESKSRTRSGPTAPAMGLYLKNVEYSIDN